MSTENIVKFLQTAYTDEKLAALLAHAQDGKLSLGSCCCLVGFPNADHVYRGKMSFRECIRPDSHYMRRTRCSVEHDAEVEFNLLANTDEERRRKIIPLILAEMERRELLRTLPDLPLSEQLRLEEEAAAEEGAAIEASGYMDPANHPRFA